ncbi:hypothetical protein HPP92_009400 [Vanilla planifolia]|uniref:Receptor-like serine/threonine-protein kinase n=1 Tax=Vanilla planifolia TaxID=51239 RepID=A0A835V6X6_VANPL|nr:hypothetical protein HPP92_009400 [Vanilla planifolia]
MSTAYVKCCRLHKWPLFVFSLVSLTGILQAVHSATILQRGYSLKDGDILDSPAGTFHLGFFTSGNSSNRYVGIWERVFSLQTVVWVANRDYPILPELDASLSIAGDGNLALVDSCHRLLWSSNTTLVSPNSTAMLSDYGDLILNNSGATVWESFDHPSDTYLAGMKISLDLITNSNKILTSWKKLDDPSMGNFSLGVTPAAQIILWENGRPRWRSGQWNGQAFIGIPDMVSAASYGFKLSVFIKDGKIYYYTDFNSSHRWVLSSIGTFTHLMYFESTDTWLNLWEAPATECDKYNRCGNYGICSDGAVPFCSCLKGFVPKSSLEWNSGNWSGGCVRRTRVLCESNGMTPDGDVGDVQDRFHLMQGVKLPDFFGRASQVVNVRDCGQFCLKNCSCKAFSFVDAFGCMIWESNLVDINVFRSGGNDLNVRLAASEFTQDDAVTGQKKTMAVYVIVGIVLAGLLSVGCIALIFCKYRRRKVADGNSLIYPGSSRKQVVEAVSPVKEMQGEDKEDKSHEIPHISFRTILAATSYFAGANLLGKGGFGPVYKGTLSGGQEIAVKKLSTGSGQGMEEFKNEVILIAKLQHRNLVRLLGFCTENEDQILVYEYMPNKSLDSFIFESSKKVLLDWEKRLNIIEGIARGLLYLHRDSRLRIIHRDLKASNILLDEDMNPKISDFGLARIFSSDNNETSTRRVVGTYGYMSPEYAMQGIFSVKSDVYSFGVLLLEIISGKKNNTYRHTGLNLSLLAYAWKLWNEENVMGFVDPTISDSCSLDEVSRCINVGLLCVQDRTSDRPSMSSVIVMLESGVSAHTEPMKPTFAFDAVSSDTQSHSYDGRAGLIHEFITILTGR